jgi:predicted HAD superfamily hydrolase
MKKYKYIFVDYFDTVVYRKTSPKNMFRMWAFEMEKYFNCQISQKELFCIRENVDTNSNQIFWQTLGACSYEKYLKKIVEKLEAIYPNIIKNFDINDIISKSLNIDEMVEIEQQCPIKKTINKLKKYKKDGAKIFCVSDFYLPKASYLKFLKNINLENFFDDIFVSSDYEKSKSTGELFKTVLKEKNIDKKDCLMIGDNYIGDYSEPMKLGIDAKLIKHDIRKIKYKIFDINYNKSLEKDLNKVFRHKSYNIFSNYAFSFYLYIERLYKNLVKNNIDEVFFLSRDGFFLRELFENYQNDKKIKIKTHYFLVSRNSVYMASLRPLEEENFDLYFSSLPMPKKSSINDFLKTLQFSNDEIEKIKCNFSTQNNLNFDERKNILFLTDTYKNLIKNNIFRTLYEQKRFDKKKEFFEYFDSFKFDTNKTLAIADVGWRCSTQRMLYRIFDEKIKITGFYIGVTIRLDQNKNNITTGLLFDNESKIFTEEEIIFKKNHLFFEIFLRANHGKVMGYKTGKGTFLNDKDVELYEKYICKLQTKIKEKFLMIKNILDKNFTSADAESIMFSHFHLKIFKNFSLRDFYYVKNIYENFSEGFGKMKNDFHLGLSFIIKEKIKSIFFKGKI